MKLPKKWWASPYREGANMVLWNEKHFHENREVCLIPAEKLEALVAIQRAVKANLYIEPKLIRDLLKAIEQLGEGDE